MLDQTLLAEAQSLAGRITGLRRAIHSEPELGLFTPKTRDKVRQALAHLPIEWREGASTTGLVAVIRGANPQGRSVLLRGDMDALPMPEDTGLDFASEVDGAMHACGHDAHVSMLAGAAKLLAGRRDDIAGRVGFMFQPGEEGHHGAKHMLDEGLLDQAAKGAQSVSAAFALHITTTFPSGLVFTKGGPLLASADNVRITVMGQGGHASMPHHAVDPIPVACEIVTALQTMVTRRIDAFDPAVITIARILAGTTSNVIPESAEIYGTVRTVSAKTRKEVADHIQRLADGICAAHGCEALVELEVGYPVTVNDDDMARFLHDSAADLLGEHAAIHMNAPVMGAEDWSYVLQEVPGAMAFLGARPDVSGPVHPNHSNRMILDESAMAAGIAVYSGVALRWLGGAAAT
jgi:hippurate hydrolase